MAQTKTAEAVYRRSDSTRTIENPDKSVTIVDLMNKREFYNVDKHAAEVWMALDGKVAVKAIVAKLRKKHDLPNRFEADVDELLAQLKKVKLID